MATEHTHKRMMHHLGEAMKHARTIGAAPRKAAERKEPKAEMRREDRKEDAKRKAERKK